jgi:hypothetical protein
MLNFNPINNTPARTIGLACLSIELVLSSGRTCVFARWADTQIGPYAMPSACSGFNPLNKYSTTSLAEYVVLPART